MIRTLRSHCPRGSYLWTVRNARWRALGIPEDDCEKPKIAIVNSSSRLVACFAHLDGIVPVPKEAIRAAGAAAPFEIRAAAPSDFVISAGGRGGYILATRDDSGWNADAPLGTRRRSYATPIGCSCTVATSGR